MLGVTGCCCRGQPSGITRLWTHVWGRRSDLGRVTGSDPPGKGANTETWLESSTPAGAGQDKGGWRRAVLLLGALCVSSDPDASQAGSRATWRV